ncbi:MAG: adenosylcobinamide-GDP ribazoletransferase [Clostridiales bacterium]|nr:adenosylcobinamide-GDP ribazoletransferase [Clostridiales bacterium]
MIKSFVLMMQFFTRLPINIEIDVKRETVIKGTVFLPLIGMIVGFGSYLAYYIAGLINRDAAALAAVIVMFLITGGLHVDGLSDTTDGFFSARSKDRILEIMKDSRVGSFGVIAIVFDILAKYVLIKNTSPDIAAYSLILSCGCARSSMSLLFGIGKSARPGGMGDMFLNKGSFKYFIASSLIFGIIGFYMAGYVFMISFFACLLLSLLMMMKSDRIIGGLTGDVFGTICELAEILSLAIFMGVRI